MPSASNAKPAVIFDLGNVILFFDHRITCRKLARQYALDEEFVYRKLFLEGLEREFDLGRLSPEEFTQSCAVALGVSHDAAVFRKFWTNIFWENVEVTRLIKELRGRARLVLLSNTNVLHFEHVYERFEILREFDDLVLSFRLGYRKPDARIFHAAKKAVGVCDPILFVDDIYEHVVAARESGFEATCFTRAEALRDYLCKYNIL